MGSSVAGDGFALTKIVAITLHPNRILIRIYLYTKPLNTSTLRVL